MVLLRILVASLAWLSLGSPAEASPLPDAPVAVFTYDALVYNAPGTASASERGPPAAGFADTTHDAGDRWSHGPSARPAGAMPSATYTYDHPVLPVQVARGTSMTLGRAGATAGLPSPLEPSHLAAKSADEAGALVRYDPMAASRNLLGQVGEGYARTPSGYTVSAHAAERIVYGAPGRSPTTLSRVDDILNNPTRTMMRDNGTIRVFQGKDWVAVRDTGPIHIVTVMVR
ncbi:hypothetical protein BJ980_001674 [Nocardioides daedukensis]|uniref:Uncharacterized protein n=1 Tax=Nocardioides daedukensis TaxID=634462 RepID=A0A7Y9UQM2_9ACTN|nr:hypothetical protein [Nocardioides daedukensis]NYG58751.1 hypothetical protein [Nocardioides daedukensis]